jgi:hypothetical protein
MAEKNVRAPAPKSDEVGKRKRFRIEKLEERIAPKKGGKGTHNCGTANCTSFSISGGGY